MDSNEHQTESEASDSTFLWKPTKVNVNGWMELIIENLLPFSSCDYPKFLPHIKYEKITTETFTKYIALLTKAIEEKIKYSLPSKFCLIFDGRSNASDYFVAIYTTYPSKSQNGYSANLLAFSPLKNEADHSSTEHISLISYVL